jgi:sugar (pentulose or hexulose) kinase
MSLVGMGLYKLGDAAGMKIILALDLGTTLIKALAYTEKGELLQSVSEKYPLIKVGKNEIEQDPLLFWDIVTTLIRKIIAKLKPDAAKIYTIGLSSQGISIVPVDEKYSPLYNMLSWLDSRAVGEVREIEGRYSPKELFHITGKKLNEFYSLPKILWMKNHRSSVFAQTSRVLLPLDYIYYKFTGVSVMDHTMAGGTMLYDVKTRSWSEELFESFGLKSGLLSEIGNAGGLQHLILPPVAEELDLPSSVSVVLGAQDQKCASIGAGIDDSTAVISMGTCTAVLVTSKKPVFDEKLRIPLFSFMDNQYILESVIGTTGIVLEWLRDNFFRDSGFDQLDDMADRVEPGSRGLFFYPHFEGAGTPYLHPKVRGFLYGMTLSTGREDIVRSLLEGVAFQIRGNIEVIEEICGKRVTRVKILGGGAKSDLWCSIISAALNREVIRFESSEIAARGAAILAGVGSGLFRNCEDGYESMKDETTAFKPDTPLVHLYNSLYSKYISIEEKLIHSFQ